MEADLQTIRSAIDAIDNQIVALLQERADLSVAVGRIKQTGGKNTFDPQRERAIIDRLSSMIKPPLSRDMISAVFHIIFSISRSLQAKKRVAYLGPEGTYSYEAGNLIFPCDAEFISKNSIEGVVQEVQSERADFGVVPVENTTDGMISQTLDLMASSRLYIVREILLPIKHCLLSRSRFDEIEMVYSHPQPFAQCRQWLKTNLPRARTIVTASTSEAAITAAGQAGSAAVASENAGQMYGLDVIAENINDFHANITRFWVISRTMAATPGKAKTSLIVTLGNTPGALYQALGCFADKGVNLTKIESRPARRNPWEYLFFIDFQGSLDDENVQQAIESLKVFTREIIVLGSYPEEGNAE